MHIISIGFAFIFAFHFGECSPPVRTGQQQRGILLDITKSYITLPVEHHYFDFETRHPEHPYKKMTELLYAELQHDRIYVIFRGEDTACIKGTGYSYGDVYHRVSNHENPCPVIKSRPIEYCSGYVYLTKPEYDDFKCGHQRIHLPQQSARTYYEEEVRVEIYEYSYFLESVQQRGHYRRIANFRPVGPLENGRMLYLFDLIKTTCPRTLRLSFDKLSQCPLLQDQRIPCRADVDPTGLRPTLFKCADGSHRKRRPAAVQQQSSASSYYFESYAYSRETVWKSTEYIVH
ncbi:hypothetical protein T4A_9511 [Trichinella pseudospiralis]|uniref:Uncharacterized protein n=1 Tax=Trichinella pseudospiralis TaxID=6337 RepID=A0A0V1FH70_TRIPS|nr:hypothetical protein T4E_5780 [Trichinella pseudospiralis]KRY79710.1 hypothetical protein T4A_9511 [Trichinella pseudospiralis]KRY85399.1 hypothetical protein T4D_3104 [Trichinella pseudospiralis]